VSVQHLLHWFVAVSFLMLLGCTETPETTEQPVARVNEAFLYPSDLEGLVPEDATLEDSTTISQNYIEQWCKETVELHQAELNLDASEKDVQRKLEEYRRSLIIYTYEKALIEQEMDTVVPAEEIEAYYQQNSSNFELRDYIVKVLYIKMDTFAVTNEDLNRLYKLKKPEEDWKALEVICKTTAANYYYDSEAWVYLDNLLQEVPLSMGDKDAFLENNRYLQFEKGAYRYYLNILEYKLKENLSPLSLEKENIRNIILQKRRRKFIEQMQHDLYQDAKNKQQVEYY